MKQLQLFYQPLCKSFGGELLKDKRKSARPLDSRKALHIVLRAKLESGQNLRFEEYIEPILLKYATKFSIRIYDVAVADNHIHLLTKIPDRELYNNFVRASSGEIARTCNIKWAYRPFTRIVEWGRDYKRAKDYVFKNELEASGLLPYSARLEKF